MNKIAIFAFLSFFLSSSVFAADAVRKFQADGEVTSVDPVYSQITIEHGPIKDFAHDGQTEFYVLSADLLKNISKGDLVDFDFTDTRGDVRIDKITKTGTAPPKEDGVPLGQAVSDTLRGVGEVAKTVTSPIPPVSEALGGAMNSTADVTAGEARMKDGEVKQNIATF